jgi:beta-lactamase regulating signal transducer with metallopeptidase domain
MERFLVEYLVNSIWQAALLAAAAWLLLRAIRPTPIMQHRVWIATLLLMLVMPLLTLRTPTTAPIVPPATPSASDFSTAIPTSILSEPSRIDLPSPSIDPSPAPQPALSSLPVTKNHSPSLPPPQLKLGPAATRWLIGLYLAITAFMAFRLLCSWWLTLRIVAQAAPARLHRPASTLLDQCCERFGVRRPRVLVSPRTASPMLVGVTRPSLLLPEDFAARLADPAASPDREQEAVWLHELAHLRRSDYLANLVCRIAALPIAFHPATHAVQQRIRQTREMVCDSVAAKEMQSPHRYAQCLVGLARNLHGTTVQIEAVGILNGGILEERIMQLITPRIAVSKPMRAVRLATCAAIVLSVMAAATTLHLTPAMAQTAASTHAPVATPAISVVPAPATHPTDQSQPAATANSAPPAAKAQSTTTAKSTHADSRTQDPDLSRQLDEARKRLDEDAKTYDQLLSQKDGALLRDELQNQKLADRLAEAQNMEALAAQMQTALAKYNNPLFQQRLQSLSDPAFKQYLEKLRQQLAEETEKFKGTDFRSQLQTPNAAELRGQMGFASDQLQELNQLMTQTSDLYYELEMQKYSAIQKQMATLNSPEFQKQVEALSKQIAEATARFNSTEFKKQMESFNSPEYKQQMEQLKDQFKQQLDQAQKQLDQNR